MLEGVVVPSMIQEWLRGARVRSVRYMLRGHWMCPRGVSVALPGQTNFPPHHFLDCLFAYLLEHSTLDLVKRLFLRTQATGFD